MYNTNIKMLMNKDDIQLFNFNTEIFIIVLWFYACLYFSSMVEMVIEMFIEDMLKSMEWYKDVIRN